MINIEQMNQQSISRIDVFKTQAQPVDAPRPARRESDARVHCLSLFTLAYTVRSRGIKPRIHCSAIGASYFVLSRHKYFCVQVTMSVSYCSAKITFLNFIQCSLISVRKFIGALGSNRVSRPIHNILEEKQFNNCPQSITIYQ